MYCFVHFLLQFLASLQELHFPPCTQMSHILRTGQVVHFNVSHTYWIPSSDDNSLWTNIAWILFCTVVDLPVAEFMVGVDISYIINSPFEAVYQPA